MTGSVGSLDEAQRNPGEEDLSRIPFHSIRATELSAPRTWSVQSLVVLSLVLLSGVIVAVQYFSLPISGTQLLVPNTQSALPLPDKPSIIVLPLVNLSGDPEQEYFSELGKEAEPRRSDRSAAAQSPIFAGGSQAEIPDQRSSGVGATYCRIAQGGTEVNEK